MNFKEEIVLVENIFPSQKFLYEKRINEKIGNEHILLLKCFDNVKNVSWYECVDGHHSLMKNKRNGVKELKCMVFKTEKIKCRSLFAWHEIIIIK